MTFRWRSALRSLTALLIGTAAPVTAAAHPLDALVQSAFFTVHRDSLFLELDFAAGARVAPAYFAFIDRDRNGRLDVDERRLYIAAVLRAVTLRVQGRTLALTLEADRWPTDAQLRDGEGMIRLFWRVAMPSAGSKTDTVQVVSFENLHAPVSSGYLVNALVDSLTVPIVGTRRSWSQQQFALSVLINAPQSAAMAAGSLAAGTTRWARWLRVVPGFVRHGMYHVATGFDHVVFVIALLLGGGRWQRIAGIVTSFTVAHSVTLSLAVLGIVVPPTRAVEAAIAASIVIVGWQALRAESHARAGGLTGAHLRDPRFPLAFGFGLLHGLGFASAMQTLMLPTGQLPVALAGFNIGIELAQMVIVLTVWPLLSLLRARASAPVSANVVRVCAALVMMTGSYWFVERIFARS